MRLYAGLREPAAIAYTQRQLLVEVRYSPVQLRPDVRCSPVQVLPKVRCSHQTSGGFRSPPVNKVTQAVKAVSLLQCSGLQGAEVQSSGSPLKHQGSPSGSPIKHQGSPSGSPVK